MNIFVLDRDPALAARYHNDRHCVKMVLESAQLLATAHVITDGAPTAKMRIGADYLPRPTHVNHPCAKWARASSANYDWLQKLFGQLVLEYSLRYEGRVHAYEPLVDLFKRQPLLIPFGEMTPFAQCMPERYHRADPVEAYRLYYYHEKQHIAQWRKPAVTPMWWHKMGRKAA